jgi:hypothetical protein
MNRRGIAGFLLLVYFLDDNAGLLFVGKELHGV